MANVEEVPRKGGTTGYKIRFRVGGTRDGKQCSETFDDPKLAARFKTDVEYHGHQYPPNYVPKVGYVTEEQLGALRAAADLEDRARTAILFPDFAADVIDKISGIEPQTRANYHRLVNNHMAPYEPFATADITDSHTMDAGEIGAWVNWLERGVPDTGDPDGLQWLRAPLSPKTIANLHGLLYTIMQKLTEGEHPRRKYNPCVGTTLPRLDDAIDEEMVFLTPQEFGILYNAAHPSMRDFLVAKVGTGMRFSEITAQKCKDYQPHLTWVHRAWKRQADNSFKLDKPKTKAGRRRVQLDEITDDVFARRCAGRDPDDYTFTTLTGIPIRHNNFFPRYWQPTVYRAVRCEYHRGCDRERGMLVDGELVRLTNIKALRQRHLRPCRCPGTLTKVPRMHDMRHTYVSWQIAGNVPLSAIARAVGHESVNTTDKVYGHLLPELDQRQALATYSALSAAGFVLAA